MLLMILLTVVAIVVAIQSRKTMDWCDFAYVTFLAYVTVFLATLILSETCVDKVKRTYPIIPVNGKYFTLSTDRYGQSRYYFHYKTDNAIVVNTTSAFIISDECKVVYTDEVSKLGYWGWGFANQNDTTWEVFAPETVIKSSTTTIEQQ